MNTAVFVARVFGLCYLILGTGFIINRKAFGKVMEDLCKNAALVFMAGLFALVVGVVIILKHNVWTADWTVIITIIGWTGLIKGVWMITFPDSVSGFMRAYQKNENLVIFHGIAALAFGIILTYFGFFA